MRGRTWLCPQFTSGWIRPMLYFTETPRHGHPSEDPSSSLGEYELSRCHLSSDRCTESASYEPSFIVLHEFCFNTGCQPTNKIYSTHHRVWIDSQSTARVFLDRPHDMDHNLLRRKHRTLAQLLNAGRVTTVFNTSVADGIGMIVLVPSLPRNV